MAFLYTPRPFSNESRQAAITSVLDGAVPDRDDLEQLRAELFDQEPSRRCDRQPERGEVQIPGRVASGDAPDRHPDEARQQDDVRKECQEHDMRREPSDASEFQKQDEPTDEEQVESRSVAHE